MLKTYSREFTIASYQTDPATRIRPSALLEIMQEMAGTHADLLNVGRSRLLPMNLAWVLARTEVRLERYPCSGETITVETFPMPNRRLFFPRSFIFRDAQGQYIGCAGTIWVLLDMTARKMTHSAEIVASFPDNSDLTAPMGMPATVEEAGGECTEAVRLPVYTDLDMNGHVNNTRYLDWCCNALGIEVMRSHSIPQFAVNYHQEILPGQSVATVLHREGKQFSFSGFDGDRRLFDMGGTLQEE